MLKKVFLILLCFAGLASSAQVDKSQPITDPDTAWKKILVVPYNPTRHLSDADVQISEYSKQPVDLIRAIFRRGLLQSVTTKLFNVYESHPMRYEGSKETQQDLEMIYGSVSYGMDTIYSVLHPSVDSLEKKKSPVSKKHSVKVKEIHDLTYMNIRLSHPELLKKLSEKYGNDLFLFLNQFEISTNYNDCLDLALKIYRRQMKVHYSAFDATGKQVYGDVAFVDFPNNINDITVIMQKNFPKISNYILQSIPKKK